MDFHLGIDARSLSGQLTGIGTYVYEIIKRLEIRKITLYTAPSKISAELPNHFDAKSWRLPRQVALKYAFGGEIKRDRIDVFWAPQTLLPSNRQSIPTVSTIHDLNHLYVPETMSWATRLAHKLWFNRDIHKADILVCNSAATATRVEKEFGLRSLVSRPGVSEDFYPRSQREIDYARKVCELPSTYLLAVSTIEPRKNIPNLLKAHDFLFRRGEVPPLVLVGRNGWKPGMAGQQTQEGVIYTGYVDRQLLPAIFSGAAGFVMPSIYEGFGMPAAEARACGCRVMTSDTPELREATGELGIFVETSTDSIIEGIRNLLKSRPHPPSRNFTWEAASEVYMKAFKSALS